MKHENPYKIVILGFSFMDLRYLGFCILDNHIFCNYSGFSPWYFLINVWCLDTRFFIGINISAINQSDCVNCCRFIITEATTYEAKWHLITPHLLYHVLQNFALLLKTYRLSACTSKTKTFSWTVFFSCSKMLMLIIE